MWIRLCPGGVGMASRGPRIRESASGRMEGRKAVVWAGSTKVHSGRPSHNRPDESEVMTDSDMRLDVMFEGTQRGTPRKRALFGPGCSESVSPVRDAVEAQTGWPTVDKIPVGARSPGVGLADVVARLQKEVEDFRSESGYDCPGKTLSPPQHSGWAGFTSMACCLYNNY